MKTSWIVLFCLISILGNSCSQAPTSYEQSTAASEESPYVDAEVLNQAVSQVLASSSAWSSFDYNVKYKVIETMVNLYKIRENTAILKLPSFYVQRVDDSFAENTELQQLPFPEFFKILAVMEYDFYNGENKDDLARGLLGERMYESNKQRLRDQAEAAGQ